MLIIVLRSCACASVTAQGRVRARCAVLRQVHCQHELSGASARGSGVWRPAGHGTWKPRPLWHPDRQQRSWLHQQLPREAMREHAIVGHWALACMHQCIAHAAWPGAMTCTAATTRGCGAVSSAPLIAEHCPGMGCCGAVVYCNQRIQGRYALSAQASDVARSGAAGRCISHMRHLHAVTCCYLLGQDTGQGALPPW
jgi:hypothetical protein